MESLNDVSVATANPGTETSLEVLTRLTPGRISMLPRAGLPEIVSGPM
jgi:hypothetical protein